LSIDKISTNCRHCYTTRYQNLPFNWMKQNSLASCHVSEQEAKLSLG